MKNFSWYSVNEKYYKVLSVRIFGHTYRILIKKINKKWHIDVSHTKFEQLDIIPLYYEVGFLKYYKQEEKK